MQELLESSVGIMAIIMAGIFLAAGVKLWQQNKEEKAKKP